MQVAMPRNKKQDRANARGDRGARVRIVHSRVQAEHSGESIHYSDAAQQESEVLGRDRIANHR